MSEATTVKRGPGRPRKNPLEAPAAPITETHTPAPVAVAQTATINTIPDYELENYGGDIAAWDSVPHGRKLALRGDYDVGAYGTSLPDLTPPGSLVNRHNPTMRPHPAWWEDVPTSSSRAMFATMVQKGYKVAMAEDWIVAPELRAVITADSTGRLTFASGRDGAMVVVYQSESDYRAHQKRLLRNSDSIQKTAEERAAMLEETLRRGGMSGVRSTLTVEDDL
jgi:hypothetical protein